MNWALSIHNPSASSLKPRPGSPPWSSGPLSINKERSFIFPTVYTLFLDHKAHQNSMFRQQFGKAPSGARLAAIQQSSHYRDGKFQNIHHTPSLTEGYSMPGVLYNFMFRRFPRTRPAAPIPSVKTHLKQLPAEQNLLVWFGHSSYYIQLNGKRFLIDPVFSGNASPIPNSCPRKARRAAYKSTSMAG